MTDPVMLAVEDVVVLYGDSLVLQGVSLEVDQGEVVALLGRNGAGKTTTLRGIMGLVRPRSGSIRLAGEELVGSQPHVIARSGVSFVPDDRRIFPDLTVEQNLGLAARTSRKTSRKTSRSGGPWTVDRIYEVFPVLKEYRRRGGLQLSGGEQKMLAIGRALVQNPRLLLLDEAAEGVAPIVVEMLTGVIREIASSGITILLADQNIRFARRVATRGYIIDKGTIEHSGNLDDIWANENVVRRYLAV